MEIPNTPVLAKLPYKSAIKKAQAEVDELYSAWVEEDSIWEELKAQLEVDVEAMNTARDYFSEDILNGNELIAEIDKVLSTVRKMQTLVKGIPCPDL